MKKIVFYILISAMLLAGCSQPSNELGNSASTTTTTESVDRSSDLSTPSDTTSADTSSQGQVSEEGSDTTSGVRSGIDYESLTPITCDLVSHDIAYYEPEKDRLEQWKLTQVREYLGGDFQPTYLPEGLQANEAPQFDAFITEVIEGERVWTVAYQGDGSDLRFAQFGLTYREALDTGKEPSQQHSQQHSQQPSKQRSLTIQVAKDRIPVSDLAYFPEGASELSWEGRALRYGSYQTDIAGESTASDEGANLPAKDSEGTSYLVAEWMDHQVGYRLLGQNLSQEEFLKVLASIPGVDGD